MKYLCDESAYKLRDTIRYSFAITCNSNHPIVLVVTHESEVNIPRWLVQMYPANGDFVQLVYIYEFLVNKL